MSDFTSMSSDKARWYSISNATTASTSMTASLTMNWADVAKNSYFVKYTPVKVPPPIHWVAPPLPAAPEPLKRAEVLNNGRIYALPDGALIRIDDLGNYKIEDKDAKVTYAANKMREWSPHLNASDMVAKFVEYVASIGVKQHEVLGLPIELFINWLIVEAAERDQDPVDEEAKRALLVVKSPKCLGCGRFIPRLYYRNRFPFCNPEHGIIHLQKRQKLLERKTA